MPVSKDYLPIAGASGAQDTGVSVYKMSQSIRFDETRNTYLIKNFGNSNSKTFTLSFWWRIGQHPSVTSARQTIFSAGASAGASFTLYHNHNSATIDGLTLSLTGSAEDITLTRTFKDPSAWYHVVVACDSTDTVTTNRVRFYVNGLRESSFVSASYPSLNSDFYVNYAGGGTNTYWGARAGLSTGEMFDGYLAEINFIDGQALGPEHFGEFNAHDLWIPIEYSGTYGTNGYLIQGGTASALGTDTSSNSNNFANSALQASDQVLDNPTDVYEVMNPNDNYWSGYTFKSGNLDITRGGTTQTGAVSTTLLSTGKWYAEVYMVGTAASTYTGVIGTQRTASNQVPGKLADGYSYENPSGNVYNNSSGTSHGSSFDVGEVLGIALDLDNNKIFFSINGTFQNSSNPAAGSNGTSISATPGMGGYLFTVGDGGNASGTPRVIWNFGQDSTFGGRVSAGTNTDTDGKGEFKYAVPSGFRRVSPANFY